MCQFKPETKNYYDKNGVCNFADYKNNKIDWKKRRIKATL